MAEAYVMGMGESCLSNLDDGGCKIYFLWCKQRQNWDISYSRHAKIILNIFFLRYPAYGVFAGNQYLTPNWLVLLLIFSIRTA